MELSKLFQTLRFLMHATMEPLVPLLQQLQQPLISTGVSLDIIGHPQSSHLQGPRWLPMGIELLRFSAGGVISPPQSLGRVSWPPNHPAEVSDGPSLPEPEKM